MKQIAILIAALTIAGVAGAIGVQASRRKEAINSAPPKIASETPVLVELFTSEGCSSCPPADELLQKLKAEQSIPGAHIIALGQHVDYWNHLGWTDRYSSHDFSDRQYAYAAAIRSASVYTPQMVVDGKVEFVGSDAGRARSVIAEAARQTKPAQITVSGDAKNGAVEVAALPARTLDAGETADVYLAVVEDGLSTQVERGENGGRRLAHAAVARQLTKIGSLKPGESFSAAAPLRLSPDVKRNRLSLIAFVQAHRSRRILGVSEKSLR